MDQGLGLVHTFWKMGRVLGQAWVLQWAPVLHKLQKPRHSLAGEEGDYNYDGYAAWYAA